MTDQKDIDMMEQVREEIERKMKSLEGKTLTDDLIKNIKTELCEISEKAYPSAESKIVQALENFSLSQDHDDEPNRVHFYLPKIEPQWNYSKISEDLWLRCRGIDYE